MAAEQTNTHAHLRAKLFVSALSLTRWLLEPPEPMAPPIDIVSVESLRTQEME